MFEFIQNIADIIVTVIGFFINALRMLIDLITVIPKALLYIIQAIGYLPPFVGSVVIVSVSVAVILMLINHGGD